MGAGGEQKPDQQKPRTTAGFTPRIYPRPEPYKSSDVYKRAVVRHLGGAAKCVLATKLFWPAYASAAAFWIETRGWSERTFFIVCISLVHSFLYWVINGAFLLCDRRRYLEQYKMERTEAMGPSDALLMQTWRQALIGQLVITPCVLWLLFDFYTRMGLPPALSSPPGALGLAGWYMGCMLFNDWGFYWSHRLAHAKPFYATVHKQHHQYKGTIGFAAEFAGPIEQAFSNQIPTVGFCVLGGAHLAVTCVWLAGRLCQTYEGHSGYCFAGTTLYELGLLGDAAPYHDFHHTVNSGNFGAEYLDHTFGTMDAWLRLGGVEGYLAKKKAGSFGNVLNDAHPSRKKGRAL